MKKLLFALSLAVISVCASAQTLLTGPTKVLGPTTFPLSGTANPALVLSCGTALSGAQTSITCQMKNAGGANTNLTAGQQLFVCVFNSTSTGTIWSGDTGAFTADPGSGTAITNFSWAGGSNFATCAYKNSVTGGGSTVTATGSYSYPSILGVVVSNGIFDQSDNAVSGTATTTPASGNITPTQNNSLLIGMIAAFNGPTIAAGTNVAWVIAPQGTNTSTGAAETFLQTTAASVNATATLGSSQFSFAHIVSFKP